MNEAVYETFRPESAQKDDFQESDSESADGQEQVFTRLDSELFPLVAANADVIVRCWWMGGGEVTLSEAVNGYYTAMTEENVDMVIADVLALLADPVLEGLEPDVLEPEPEPQEFASDEPKDQKESTKSQPPLPIAKSKPTQKPAIEPVVVAKPYTQQARPASQQAEWSVVGTKTTILAAEEQPTARAEPGDTKPMAPPNVLVEAQERLPRVVFEPTINEDVPEVTIESRVLPQPAAKKVLEVSEVDLTPVEDTLQAEAVLPNMLEEEAVAVESCEPLPLFNGLSLERAEAQELYEVPSEGSDLDGAPASRFEPGAIVESSYAPETSSEPSEHIDSAEPEIAAEANERIEQVIKLVELASETIVPQVQLEIMAELAILLAEFTDEQLRLSAPLLLAQAVLKQANYFSHDDQTVIGSPTHEFINEPQLGLNNSKSPAAYSVLGRPATRAYLLNFS